MKDVNGDKFDATLYDQAFDNSTVDVSGNIMSISHFNSILKSSYNGNPPDTSDYFYFQKVLNQYGNNGILIGFTEWKAPSSIGYFGLVGIDGKMQGYWRYFDSALGTPDGSFSFQKTSS